MEEKSDGDEAKGEVLPPEGSAAVEGATNILALVDNYTDRPDLLVAEIERHDPGFVKRMNASSEAHSESYRTERLTFGKNQAYVALGVAAVAALAILVFVGIAVVRGAGFWTIIALAVFYAVTQGGPGGFARLIEGCVDAIKRFSGKGDTDA